MARKTKNRNRRFNKKSKKQFNKKYKKRFNKKRFNKKRRTRKIVGGMPMPRLSRLRNLISAIRMPRRNVDVVWDNLPDNLPGNINEIENEIKIIQEKLNDLHNQYSIYINQLTELENNYEHARMFYVASVRETGEHNRGLYQRVNTIHKNIGELVQILSQMESEYKSLKIREEQLITIKQGIPRYNCNIDDECAICLDTLQTKDYKKLLCGHCFHTDCLSTYINQKNSLCPLCKENIIIIQSV